MVVKDDGQPLLAEDDCWEFFADSMAPFTSPSASAVKEAVQNTLPVEDAKQLIDDFFRCLGAVLHCSPTYRVSIHLHW